MKSASSSSWAMFAEASHRMALCYHPTIGHLFVPGLTARIPHENGGYFVRTNSLGFRSDIEFPKKKSGRPRILFLGDSYTAGDGCDNQQRFADVAGRLLNAEVFNFGVSGTGTDQQCLIYETFAREVEADLVVLGVTVENIERNKAAYRRTLDRTGNREILLPKPYFSLEGGRLELCNVPVPRARPRPGEVPAEGVQERTEDRFQILTKILRLYRGSPRLERLRRMTSSFAPEIRSRMLRTISFQPYPDYADRGSRGWRLMEAILKRFIEQVDVPLVILPIPVPFFYCDRLEPIYQPLFETLENREAGVHVLNPTRVLAEAPLQERMGYRFRQDDHFSPAGHQAMASVLASELAERGLIRPEPVPAAASPRKSRSRDRAILGISCFYHNSAAALIRNGVIVAAAEEERFTRKKHDRRFPLAAINYCLEEAGLHPESLSAIAYYDNASLTFERLMHTLIWAGSDGHEAWRQMLPSWLMYKLRVGDLIRRHLRYEGPVLQGLHHRSHAASAFYPSPFEDAAILTVDGVGEWATASIGLGRENRIHLLKEMHFPHSLGLLYSAFTEFTGFRPNSGEYKLMGLAPYGEPRYAETILTRLVDLKQDGSIELDLDYFGFLEGSTMTNDRFAELFGGPARRPETRITQREMDLAKSIQSVTEMALLRMARHARKLTGASRLCLAGGVALNCVANGKILRDGVFDDIWVQPAAGDAGGAVGAAFDVYYSHFGSTRQCAPRGTQRGSFLGPSYSAQEIRSFLDTYGYPFHPLEEQERADRVAEQLAEGKVVGHFSGRCEYGPRALGARSILGDPRDAEMQTTINLKIKYRESFRPFAPAVLVEKCSDYFELDRESPYMLIVAPVNKSLRLPLDHPGGTDLLAIVRRPRSSIPAVTHVDYSARVQTVTREDHPPYYDVLDRFNRRTGCGVLVNTSFNVRGEPIVLSPQDAYRCFMRTEMDVLVLGDCILYKTEQPPWREAEAGSAGSEKPTEFSAELLEKLSSVFQEQFVPLARDLRGACLIPAGFQKLPTSWVDCRAWNPASTLAVSQAPVEESPARQARRITSVWSRGEVRERLEPLIADLLEISRQFESGEELVEEVSECMYVMF